MPPSSSFPWALILEHSVMGYAYQFQFSLPKSCLLAGEGGDKEPQPDTRQWEGHWGSLSSGHQAYSWAQCEDRLSWAKGWAQLSRAHGLETGQGSGGWQPALLLLHGPSSTSWHPQGLIWAPGGGQWGGGTEQGHCVLALLLRPWQKLSLWTISLLCSLFQSQPEEDIFFFYYQNTLPCIKAAFSFVMELPQRIFLPELEISVILEIYILGILYSIFYILLYWRLSC